MLFRENGKIYQIRAAGWYLAREPKKKILTLRNHIETVTGVNGYRPENVIYTI